MKPLPTDRPSADLWRLLAGMIDRPDARHRAWCAALDLAAATDLDALRAAHTEAFVTQCAPYISVYVGQSGHIGGEAAARVADFRRLLGAHVDDATPDAMADVLADYADLVALAADGAQAAHARRAMFWEHIAPWGPGFALALSRSAPPPYDGWARLFQTALTAEAAQWPTPPALALHLRAAPEWSAPGEGATHADVARALLVPAATGVILTRSDLFRAGTELGMALPIAGRAALLEILFQQDLPGTRAWLAHESLAQADALAAAMGTRGQIASFWRQRARATAAWLADSDDRRALGKTPTDRAEWVDRLQSVSA